MKRQPLTASLIEAAINGRIPLGLYGVSRDGLSKWSAWDVDTDAQWPQLVALAQYLDPQQHILLEQSRRGGHLFAFHQPTAWHNANSYGQQLATQFGLEGIEVYPKFNKLHSLRMPGTKHPKTGVTYPIIHPLTGELLSLTEALDTITPIVLPDVPLPSCPEISVKSNSREFPGGSTDFYDLVYELSKLTRVRLYSSERGVARCPWHFPDKNPSLFLKGRRMHCLSSNCGVYGDSYDVRRWIEQGVRPPQ